MSVQLEIQDGSTHWWLSPDVWTVPGDDPEGSPGLPIVGEPCYVWARVHNIGTDAVTNASVRFYWANPAVGFDRNSANLVGNANVSLNAGESKEVLCLVPWQPVWVNNGHECVLAEAFHTSLDPLPPSPIFNVPTDRHVAQRNITILQIAPKKIKSFSMNFEIHNTERSPRAFTIKTELGKPAELQPLLKQLGRDVPAGTGKATKVGFIKALNPCDSDETPQPRIDRLEVGGGTRTGLTLTGELEGDAALLHVIQEVDGKEIGGLSVLVVQGKEQNKGRA
jgi:hypothetical protein